MLEDKHKVSKIKYKQMDRDPEIKKVTNEMEQLIFGEKGIGLMGGLGLSPGKIQKSLDNQWKKGFEKLLVEHQEYIFFESRKRAVELDRKWISEQGDDIQEDKLLERMQKSIKQSELEVIGELVEKHM